MAVASCLPASPLDGIALELVNLAESKDHQALVKDLFKKLLAQQRQLGDNLPLRDMFHQLN